MAMMVPLRWRLHHTTVLSGVHHAPGWVGLEMNAGEEGAAADQPLAWAGAVSEAEVGASS